MYEDSKHMQVWYQRRLKPSVWLCWYEHNLTHISSWSVPHIWSWRYHNSDRRNTTRTSAMGDQDLNQETSVSNNILYLFDTEVSMFILKPTWPGLGRILCDQVHFGRKWTDLHWVYNVKCAGPSTVQFVLFIRPYAFLWQRYLQTTFTELLKIWKLWPLALRDDLLRFWWSKVTVTADSSHHCVFCLTLS